LVENGFFIYRKIGSAPTTEAYPFYAHKMPKKTTVSRVHGRVPNVSGTNPLGSLALASTAVAQKCVDANPCNPFAPFLLILIGSGLLYTPKAVDDRLRTASMSPEELDAYFKDRALLQYLLSKVMARVLRAIGFTADIGGNAYYQYCKLKIPNRAYPAHEVVLTPEQAACVRQKPGPYSVCSVTAGLSELLGNPDLLMAWIVVTWSRYIDPTNLPMMTIVRAAIINDGGAYPDYGTPPPSDVIPLLPAVNGFIGPFTAPLCEGGAHAASAESSFPASLCEGGSTASLCEGGFLPAPDAAASASPVSSMCFKCNVCYTTPECPTPECASTTIQAALELAHTCAFMGLYPNWA
jgi:hypothetical protein